MAETLTISRKSPDYSDMDYEVLRKEAIKLLQEYASETWTDHNVHDPGITILEQIILVLTDLGFRTNFDITDILAEEQSDGFDNYEYFDLYTPRYLLTSAPFTENDYRLFLMQCRWIKNAWVTGSHNDEDSSRSEIPYKGMYDFKIELDTRFFGDEDRMVDMNDNVLRSDTMDIDIELELPHWDFLLSDCAPDAVDWNLAWTILRANRRIDLTKDEETIEIEVVIDSNGEFTDIIYKSAAPAFTLTEDEKAAVMDKIWSETLFYQSVVLDILVAVGEAWDKLQAWRGLCEDFIRMTGVRVEKVRIDTALEIDDASSPEQVLGEVFYDLHNHLSKQVGYATYEEKKEAGVEIEVMYDGPEPLKGFIDSSEIRSWKKAVYTSDIVKILWDVVGVTAILEDLDIQNYLGNYAVPRSNEHTEETGTGDENEIADDWGISLSYYLDYIPKFDIDKSEIRVLKNGIEQRVDYDAVRAYFEDKIREDISELPEPDELDPTYQKGNHRNIKNYRSVQYDFPLNYGIGFHGLPSKSSDERKAKARQLKAYLLFFDQVMVNHATQVANTGKFFAINNSVERTYYTQHLLDTVNVKELYNKSEEELDHALAEMSEKLDDFLARRASFLDHLLMRFAEEVADKGSFAYTLLGVDPSWQWINDKLAILRNYRAISSRRFTGFNHTLSHKEPGNVAGLKQRICRFAGIPNCGWPHKKEEWTDALFSIGINDTSETVKQFDYYFSLLDKDGVTQAVIPRRFSEQDAIDAMVDALNYLDDEARVLYRKDGKGRWYFRVRTPKNVILLTSALRWNTKALAQAYVATLQTKVLEWKGSAAKLRHSHIPENRQNRYTVLRSRKGKKRYFVMRDSEGAEILRSPLIDNVEWTVKAREDFLEKLCNTDEDALTVDRLHDESGHYLEWKDDDALMASSATHATCGGLENVHAFLKSLVMGEGMHLIEHILLRPRGEGEMDLPKRGNILPTACQLTFVLPGWPARFADPSYRNFLINTIRTETPSHLYPEIYFVDNEEDFCALTDAWGAFLNGLRTTTSDELREPLRRAAINALETIKRDPFYRLKDAWLAYEASDESYEETGFDDRALVFNNHARLLADFDEFLDAKGWWQYNHLFFQSREAHLADNHLSLSWTTPPGSNYAGWTPDLDYTYRFERYANWKSEAYLQLLTSGQNALVAQSAGGDPFGVQNFGGFDAGNDNGSPLLELLAFTSDVSLLEIALFRADRQRELDVKKLKAVLDRGSERLGLDLLGLVNAYVRALIEHKTRYGPLVEYLLEVVADDEVKINDLISLIIGARAGRWIRVAQLFARNGRLSEFDEGELERIVNRAAADTGEDIYHAIMEITEAADQGRVDAMGWMDILVGWMQEGTIRMKQLNYWTSSIGNSGKFLVNENAGPGKSVDVMLDSIPVEQFEGDFRGDQVPLKAVSNYFTNEGLNSLISYDHFTQMVSGHDSKWVFDLTYVLDFLAFLGTNQIVSSAKITTFFKDSYEDNRFDPVQMSVLMNDGVRKSEMKDVVPTALSLFSLAYGEYDGTPNDFALLMAKTGLKAGTSMEDPMMYLMEGAESDALEVDKVIEFFKRGHRDDEYLKTPSFK